MKKMKQITKWFISSICALFAGGIIGAILFGRIGAIIGAIICVVLISIILDKLTGERRDEEKTQDADKWSTTTV